MIVAPMKNVILLGAAVAFGLILVASALYLRGGDAYARQAGESTSAASKVFPIALSSGLSPVSGQSVDVSLAPEGTVIMGDSDDFSYSERLSDMARILIMGMPALAPGGAYEGWFVSDDGTREEGGGRREEGGGILEADPGGTILRQFWLEDQGQPTGENLFAEFNTFVVTIEPVPDPDSSPSADVALIYQVPEGGILHVRHLVYSWQGNPPYVSGFHKGTPKGIAVGLREQTWTALVHARLSIGGETLAEVHLHACHVVNIIEGDRGANFDASCGNPGDGFGVLPYAGDAAVHSGLAASAAPDDRAIAEHAQQVVGAANQVSNLAFQARDAALQALGVSDEAARLVISNVETILTRAWDRARQAYRSSQEMGTYVFGSKAPADGDGGQSRDFGDLSVFAFDGSTPDDDSAAPSISADGAFLAFQSFATKLVVSPDDFAG